MTDSQKKYRLKNKEEINRKKREYSRMNRDKIKLSGRKRKLRGYGITIDHMKQMYILQSGKCDICKTRFESRWNMCIDHNHETKRVRGLLCRPCNSLIANARENISILLNSVDYIKKWSNNEPL